MVALANVIGVVEVAADVIGVDGEVEEFAEAVQPAAGCDESEEVGHIGHAGVAVKDVVERPLVGKVAAPAAGADESGEFAPEEAPAGGQTLGAEPAVVHDGVLNEGAEEFAEAGANAGAEIGRAHV